MRRRDFLYNVGLGLAGTVGGTARPAARPNVVFVLADDQRADYLGCMGHPILQTPHIDALARRGSLFRRAYATSAICTPSRACFFLGQWERRHGINFNSQSSMDPRAFENSYPALLRRAGYFTGYVGKSHVPVGPGGYKSEYLEKQFDYWYGNHGHTLFYPKEKLSIYRNARADTQPEILLEGARNFLKPEESFLSAASDFLARRPADRPFCLTVGFNLPHSAGTGSMQLRPTDPELYRTRYRDRIQEMPRPRTYVAARDITTPKLPRRVYSGQYIPSYNFVRTPEELRERQVRTCQAVTGIDNVVGGIVAELRALGIEKNTIIVYASDHGLFHGEHGLGGKTLLYEEAIRIPLIVHDPRLPRQTATVEEFALSVDVAPTILGLCGVEAPGTMQGRSLEPLLRGRASGWRRDFFCENLFTGQDYPRAEAVREKEWKYIRYFRRIPEGGKAPHPYAATLEASIRGEQPVYEELYDLARDPSEEHNVAGETGHRGTLERLRRRCGELVREAKGAPGPPLTLPS